MSLTRETQMDSRSAQLLERYKPTFLPGTTLLEAINEAHEVVLLRFIRNMEDEIFGLNGSDLIKKFKALLSILIHTYFIQRHEWATQEDACTEKFLKEQCNNIAKAVRKTLYPHRHDLKKLNSEAYQEEAKKLLEAPLKKQIDTIKNYFKTRVQLFSGNFIYIEEEFNNIFTDILSDLMPKDEVEVIFNKVFSRLKMFAMKMEFSPILNQIWNPQEGQVDIKYKAFVDETISQVKEIFPNFNETLLIKLYEKAFHDLLSDQSVYWNHFLIELYLQQIRKPALFSEVRNALQVIYIPMTKYIYAENHLSLSKLVEWAKTATHSTEQPASLHQIISNSYTQLFSASTFLKPYRQASILLVPKADEKEVKIEDVTPLLSSIIESLFMLPVEILPISVELNLNLLFDEAAHPGNISAIDILILNSISANADKYLNRFKNLSSLPMNLPHHHDRVLAVERFAEDFQEADTVGKIAALVDISKPYINRHSRLFFDNIVGKPTTHTWSKLLKESRDTALTKLELQVTPLTDKSAVTTLECWRNLGLFSQHRANFTIRGNFGRTHAQSEIDSMIVGRRNR